MGEYRSFTMELQEQFVITIGASMMHESCVDSLASPMEQHIKALTMDQGQGEFIFLECSVTAPSQIFWNVLVVDGVMSSRIVVNI